MLYRLPIILNSVVMLVAGQQMVVPCIEILRLYPAIAAAERLVLSIKLIQYMTPTVVTRRLSIR